MLSKAYQFMCLYIHFTDNDKHVNEELPGYNPLFKVAYTLKEMLMGMRRAWRPGKHVTIDESMITYMGHVVTFVQNMPVKPILM